MKIINESKMVTVKKYEATDGNVFDTEQECLLHENTLNQRINEAKALPAVDCYIPFTDWYMDVDESKIYILHSKDEYDKLADWYVSTWYKDSLYWDEPDSYPAAMIIISREGCSNGYILERAAIQEMYKAADKLTNALLTVMEEKIEHDGTEN